MGRQASAETAPTRHRSDIQEPADDAPAPAMPARAPTPPPALPPPAAAGPPAPCARPPGTYAQTDFRPEPAAAGRARRLTRDTLARWHLDHLADDAQTIASELISNALDAATQPRGTLPAIIFAIHHRPDELRITVWDNGPGQPQPAEPGPDAETGRGLAIVGHLSREWGWWPTPHSGGKVTWAALPAPSARQDTPC
jgi:anti-sigma regulatory factor (Ser/Thr protein kinase)